MITQEMPGLSRYSLIVTADAVIGAAQTQGTLGMKTIEPGFLDARPPLHPARQAVRERWQLLWHTGFRGWSTKTMSTTGITLGFIPDAFSSFGWAGVAVIPFLVGFGYFTFYRFIITDKLWHNVWALALALISVGLSPESTLEGQIVGVLERPLHSSPVRFGFSSSSPVPVNGCSRSAGCYSISTAA